MEKYWFIIYSTEVQDIIQFGGHSVLGQAKEGAILDVKINLYLYSQLEISSVNPMF